MSSGTMKRDAADAACARTASPKMTIAFFEGGLPPAGLKMIETESRQTLDAFADVMVKIAQEAKENPQLLHDAPHDAPTRRLDEVRAAKQLVVCATFPGQD